MNPLIAEARTMAPHSEDGFLLLRLANALEAAEKMAEAALEDLAGGGRAAAPIVLLEVLPDPMSHCPDRVAIVTDHELPGLAGHVRSPREEHAGRWAYPFPRRESALRSAKRLIDDHPGVYVLNAPIDLAGGSTQDNDDADTWRKGES